MTNKLNCLFRQGYEKPLHYPCTIMVKAKPNKSIDKRLYCDIFSLYFKREKEWDMSSVKDNIEWWCYATDLERYIKQSQKDLEIAKNGLNKVIIKTNSQVVRGFEYIANGIVKVAKDTLKQIEQKD